MDLLQHIVVKWVLALLYGGSPLAAGPVPGLPGLDLLELRRPGGVGDGSKAPHILGCRGLGAVPNSSERSVPGGWPSIVGGTWLRLVGWVCGLLYNFGSRGGGLLFLAARAGAVGLDVALRVVSWLAGISFAQRSRHQEYAADLLGARVTSNSAMCGALLRLEEAARGVVGKPEEHRSWSAAWISRRLQASHPDTAARIARMRAAAAQGGELHAG